MIVLQYEPGCDTYTRMYALRTDKWWRFDTEVWEAWDNANVAAYGLDLDEQGDGGFYAVDFPVEITDAGEYLALKFEYAGTTQSLDDERLDVDVHLWDGTQEVRALDGVTWPTTLLPLINAIKAQTDLLVPGTAPIISPSVTLGGDLTIRRGDLVTLVIPYTGDLSDRTKLWFALKTDPRNDADDAAIVFIEETDGVTVVNASTYEDTTDATLTVDPGVSIIVALHATITSVLTVVSRVRYDIQYADGNGDPITIMEGRAAITADVVRAIA
jgi:hypothetical protein